MPFVLQRCPLKPTCLLFIKYFPGVMRGTHNSQEPFLHLLNTSGLYSARPAPGTSSCENRRSTAYPLPEPVGHAAISHCLVSSASSRIRTRVPLPATCKQSIVTLVRKPNHHLTTAITLRRGTHIRASQQQPVVSLPWTVTHEQPSNMPGVAAVVSPWGNILPKAGVAAGIYDSTVSSSSYYTKFLIIFQGSSRTGS